MILDTNALSAVADGESRAIARVAKARTIAIPVIVLGEYRFGYGHSRRRADYEQWLNRFVSACLVLEVNSETAMHYAEVRVELKRAGTPIPANDAWIAALCRQHSLAILTRDGHFDLVEGIERIGF